MQPQISLYSSVEVMPFARSSVVTQTDRARLVEVINNLNYALVRAIQSPEVLVGKFGPAVFCKLWALFIKNKAYDLALGAFQRWQSERRSEDLLSPALKLLLDGAAGCVETEARPDGLDVEDEDGGEGVDADDCRRPAAAISNWHCSACIVENDKDDKRCQVCGAKVPVWTCGVCLSESSIVMSACQHCRTPQAAMARLRRKLAMDPASAFARADVDDSKGLTFSEWQRAFTDEVIDDEVLRRLFDEFDINGDGEVSLEEFRSGLDRPAPHVEPPALDCLDRDSGTKTFAQEQGANMPQNAAANPASSATTREKIKVYVANCDTKTPFRIKKAAPVQKVLDAFCKQKGLDQLDVIFLFRGKELNS